MAFIGIVVLLLAAKIAISELYGILHDVFSTYGEVNNWFHQETLRTEGYRYNYTEKPQALYQFSVARHMKYALRAIIIVMILVGFAIFICHVDIFIMDIIRMWKTLPQGQFWQSLVMYLRTME